MKNVKLPELTKIILSLRLIFSLITAQRSSQLNHLTHHFADGLEIQLIMFSIVSNSWTTGDQQRNKDIPEQTADGSQNSQPAQV